MKDIIKESASAIVKDRYVFVLMLLLTIVTTLFIVYVLLNVRPSELQLVSHYSAFGATHLYRDQWYYLLLFAVFALVLLVVHVSLMTKIFLLKGRELTILLGWSSVAVVIFAWMTAYAVFNVWSPLA